MITNTIKIVQVLHLVMWCDMHAKGRQRAMKLFGFFFVVTSTVPSTVREQPHPCSGTEQSMGIEPLVE